jgi:hypothetical protein
MLSSGRTERSDGRGSSLVGRNNDRASLCVVWRYAPSRILCMLRECGEMWFDLGRIQSRILFLEASYWGADAGMVFLRELIQVWPKSFLRLRIALNNTRMDTGKVSGPSFADKRSCELFCPVIERGDLFGVEPHPLYVGLDFYLSTVDVWSDMRLGVADDFLPLCFDRVEGTAYGRCPRGVFGTGDKVVVEEEKKGESSEKAADGEYASAAPSLR